MTSGTSDEGFSFTMELTPGKAIRAVSSTEPDDNGAVTLYLPVWGYMVGALVLLVMPLLGIFGAVGMGVALAAPIGAVLGGALVAWIFVAAQTEMARRESRRDPGPVEVSLTAQGVGLVARDFSNHYAWAAVDKVGDSEDGLLIWTGSLLLALVPDDALPPGTDRAALKRQISTWRG